MHTSRAKGGSALIALVAAATLAGVLPEAEPARALAAPGDLVVNEVDYDQPGADTAEFIEIKNTTDHVIMLGTFDVLGINGANVPGTEYLRLSLPEVALGPGEYFVIGDASVANVDMVVTSQSFIQNGAPDAVAVVESEPSAPANDWLLDSVSYEGDTKGGPVLGGSWTEGSGVGLDDSGVNPNVGLSRLPDGFDTQVNNLDLSRRCITPGEVNSPASTECLPQGSGTGTPQPQTTVTVTPGGQATATATGGATPSPTVEATQTSATSAAPTATGTAVTATAQPETETPVVVATVTATSVALPTVTTTPVPAATDTPTAVPAATATPTEPLVPTATPVVATATPSATRTATTVPATATPVSTETPLATSTQGVGPPLVTPTSDPGFLDVAMQSLTASRLGPIVVVQWRTRWEISNAGFHVYRTSESGRIRLTTQRIAPQGGELKGARYSLIDIDAPAGKAQYWVVDVDTRGHSSLHGPVSVTAIETFAEPVGVPQ